MAPERVVVVGSSVGGIRAAQSLRSAGFTGEVVVVGAEDVVPYDKPPLSKQALSGEQAPGDIALLGEGDWTAEGLEPRLGSAAVALDPSRKHVVLADGELVAYDALVIATGARARTLECGEPLVHTVRELRDTLSLRERLSHGAPVVVVGSGFIGAEVASTARQLGLDVTIVEAAPEPFSGALGPEVAALVADLHRQAGVSVIGGAAVSKIEPLPDGTGVVHLSDGRRLAAGSVVVGIGVTPNTEWLESSGLPLANGVVTDEHCRVHGSDNVFAIGDVASWFDVRIGQHRRVEHWTNAVEQASLVAHNLLHADDKQPYVRAPYFWSDQHGVKIQMTGRIRSADRVEVLRCATPAGDRTIALYSSGDEFAAAVALGWPRAIVACRRAWESHATRDQVLAQIQSLSTGVSRSATS